MSKTQRLFIKILPVLLILALSYYAYTNYNHQKQFIQDFQDGFKHRNNLYLLTTILLMPLNWLIEIIRWQQISLVYNPISLKTASSHILAGNAISLFMPNRSGDYIGKLLLVEPSIQRQTILASFISTISSWLAILLLGLIGLGGIVNLYPQKLFVEPLLQTFTISLIASFFILSLALYFQIPKIWYLVRKIKSAFRFKKYFVFTKKYTSKNLLKLLVLAILRVLIYSLQYILVAYYFGISEGFLNALVIVWAIFLLQTGIPMPPMIAFVSRGSIALLVWGLGGHNPTAILASTFSLWILNVLVPGLIGIIGLFLFKTKSTNQL